MTERHRLRMRLAIALLRGLPADVLPLGSQSQQAVRWLLQLFPQTVGWNEEVGLHLTADPGRRVALDEICAELFGLSRFTAHCLFSPGAQYAVHPSLSLCYGGTAPDLFADMLEQYLELEAAEQPVWPRNALRSAMSALRFRAV